MRGTVDGHAGVEPEHGGVKSTWMRLRRALQLSSEAERATRALAQRTCTTFTSSRYAFAHGSRLTGSIAKTPRVKLLNDTFGYQLLSTLLDHHIAASAAARRRARLVLPEPVRAVRSPSRGDGELAADAHAPNLVGDTGPAPLDASDVVTPRIECLPAHGHIFEEVMRTHGRRRIPFSDRARREAPWAPPAVVPPDVVWPLLGRVSGYR